VTGLPEAETWCQWAWALVVKRHAGKTDAVGRPAPSTSCASPWNCRAAFQAATPAQVQAALLHDAFEPSGLSEVTLLGAGIDPAAITHYVPARMALEGALPGLG